jgi:pyruvate carboxylase
VVYIKVKYLKALLKTIFNLINVWLKSTNKKEVININGNNNTIIIKDRRVNIKRLKAKRGQEGNKSVILYIGCLL